MRISDWSSDVCSSDLQVEHDVHAVQEQLQQQRGARPLDAQQPAQNGIVHQGGRGAPDADIEVDAGVAGDPGAGTDGPEGDQPYLDLQQNEQKAEPDGQGDRPKPAGPPTGAVPAA